MRRLQQIFFRGLVTFIPLALTVFIIIGGVRMVDNIFGNALREILPFYIPGLGFLLTLTIILLLGLLLTNLITAGLMQQIEQKLTEVPFIKAIYSPLRDLMNLFSKGGGPEGLKTVVFVEVGDSGIKALGLVTRDAFSDIPAIEEHATDRVAVYIPFSYGLGGFTFLVPRSKMQRVDIPIEKAMSLAITGWVKVESKKDGVAK